MADLKYVPPTSSVPEGKSEPVMDTRPWTSPTLHHFSPQIPQHWRARPVSQRMTNTTPGAVRMIKLREIFFSLQGEAEKSWSHNESCQACEVRRSVQQAGGGKRKGAFGGLVGRISLAYKEITLAV